MAVVTWDHKVCVLTIETSVTVGFRSHHLAIWLSDYLVPAVLALSQISSLAQIKVSTWIVESLFSRQAFDSVVGNVYFMVKFGEGNSRQIGNQMS